MNRRTDGVTDGVSYRGATFRLEITNRKKQKRWGFYISFLDMSFSNRCNFQTDCIFFKFHSQGASQQQFKSGAFFVQRVVRPWVAMDSLKFHLGSPCPTILRPAGGPPLKRPCGCFRGGLPTGPPAACSRLLPFWTSHALRLWRWGERVQQSVMSQTRNVRLKSIGVRLGVSKGSEDGHGPPACPGGGPPLKRP
jgi:hypothetical protein